ncbi:hypothetical protein [Adonisia turfae]|uniref:hypothetical protein n=1 Tax=Adonisia turfae TaxID=2950184 RepID=UPI0032B36C5A
MHSNRGYIGIERERLDETKPADLKEAFNIGKELSTPLNRLLSTIFGPVINHFFARPLIFFSDMLSYR